MTVGADQFVATGYDTGSDDAYVSPLSSPSFTAAALAASTGSIKRRNVATDGQGTWVVCGYQEASVSTDDAVTFTAITNYGIQSVVWSGTKFYGWGLAPGGLFAYFAFSDDGVTWQSTETGDFTDEVDSFAFFGGLWVTFRRDYLNPSPAQSRYVAYNEDPLAYPSLSLWVNGDVIHRHWDVGSGLGGSALGLAMPMTLASNDAIVLSFSVDTDDVMWSEDVTVGSPFTLGTFTGTGNIWCAVWDGTQWVGGGTYDDAGTLKFNWATSADGKAWTHNNEPTFGTWCLVDGFFDGTNCWFTAIDTAGAGPGAVFQYDGATWTEYDLPAGPTGGYGIDGWPSFPVQVGSALIELVADDVGWPYPITDPGVIEMVAPDIVAVDSALIELVADDALASNAITGGDAVMELFADNLIVVASGVIILVADDAEAPDVPSGNFNPNTPCTIGNEWFPRTRGAGVLASDTQTIGVWLNASHADDIAQVWPFIANVTGRACVAVEVYDVTNGNPTITPVQEFGYFPSSDLYVAASPWTPGAFGSFNGWDPSLGAAGPFWEALDSSSLTPYTWPISGQPVDNDEFVFNFYGLGFDFAVRYADVLGTQTGRWVTNVKSRAIYAQYLALGAVGAFQIQPYLWINGTKYAGAKQSIDVGSGPVLLEADWRCNPSTGLPWTPTDLDLFDSAVIGGDTSGMGWVCQPTGSANNLATILQADLIVESAASDSRLVIGSRCVDPNGGWQRILLRSVADSQTLDSFTMTAGRDYLFVFRRGAGTGSVSLAFLDDPNNYLPGPPNWTTHVVELDPITLRPVQIGGSLTPAYAMALVKTGGSVSLDSQPYMTLSPLDGVDRFPLINEYFTNSPVNSTYSMQQEFFAASTDEYGWIWILVAQVASVTDGDLTITIRDRATDTAQGVVTVTSDDLTVPRHAWQKIGVRMDPAPTLTMSDIYYFDITSTASADQGWLVQVLDEGVEPPPQGGPTGTYASTWGGGAENLWIGSPLTEYQTKTACVTVSTIPESPTGFDAVNLGEACCLDAMVLLWDEYVNTDCGGWLAYEIQRRNPTASTSVNAHAADWFRIAYIDTSASVVSFTDWEAPNNIEVEYRLRVWRTDGAPSDWTATVAATTLSTCCGLTFTSNVSPDLTVFYPDVATGAFARGFDFPENTQTFQPYDQNGHVVYRELENRLMSFKAKLRIRSGQLPCLPDCADPATGSGTVVFDPIRAIARAGLPYVCVKNETGDVWFAFVFAEHGDWQQVAGREIDGGAAVYTFDISVLELTDTPAVPDEGVSGS